MREQGGLWYCETVKNITVSVSDELYHDARFKAAVMDTTVSALVRRYLTGIVSGKSDIELRREMQKELFEALDRRRAQGGASFSASQRLSRDEIHDRAALRRHEHSDL